METSNKHLRRYQAPNIETIRLDNSISLALESTPETPGDEPSWLGKAGDANLNDPFKTGLE